MSDHSGPQGDPSAQRARTGAGGGGEARGGGRGGGEDLRSHARGNCCQVFLCQTCISEGNVGKCAVLFLKISHFSDLINPVRSDS